MTDRTEFARSESPLPDPGGAADPARSDMERDDFWQVFICYRQVDGSEVAEWLYRHLEGVSFTAPGQEKRVFLRVYWDSAAPALDNWQNLHKPALESSRALIVVCSPGILTRFGDEDWVHRELRWWLRNRKAAPIIVDLTGEGDRWLPVEVRQRWPYAQRVEIALGEWARLATDDRRVQEQRAVERILGGIRESETKTRFEDLERQKTLSRRLGIAFAFTLIALIAALGFAVTAVRRQQDVNRSLALSTLDQARSALLKEDWLAAQTLAARAISYARSPEIDDRFRTIQFWAEQDFPSARASAEKVLDYEYTRAVEAAALPFQTDRIARSTVARFALEDWLLLTAKLGEPAYDAVLRFKGLASRVERLQKLTMVGSGKASALRQDIAGAEAELSHWFYMRSSAPADSGARSTPAPDQLLKSAHRLSGLYRRAWASNSGMSRSFPAEVALNWTRIQRALHPGEVVVDYLKYHGLYAAWVLRHEGAPERIELGSQQDIEGAIESFVAELSSLSPDGGEAAKQVRSLIWAPIERHLTPKDSITYVVPDAAVAQVPFAAIPGSEADKVLLDERTIVYLETAYEVLSQPRSGPRASGFLLIGGVDYGAMGIGADAFRPLRFSQNEVEAISSILRAMGNREPIHILSGRLAGEKQFRRVAPQHRVVHIASMGWSRTAAPDIDVQMLLSAQERSLGADAFQVSTDPSLTSGFALARYNERSSADGVNDGVMSTLEIGSLDLARVELVVLTTCDAVGGPRAGDGVMGLVRGFHKAGAKSVVATVMLVMDSRETVELIETFYAQIQRGMPAATALRKAMLMSRASGASPVIWAPYVAYGPLR